MARPSRISAMVFAGGDAAATPFLENFDGAAGGISGNADSGQARQESNGLILLSGTGYATLDDNNSPDIALLQWAGVTAEDGRTIKVTLSTNAGDSPLLLFNANFAAGGGTGTAWVLFINDDDNRVWINDYDSILPDGGSGNCSQRSGRSDSDIER
jgi:hypothetical protein